MRRIHQPALQVLRAKPVFLDTETTGLSGQDQVIEVAVIDHDGTVLLNELIQPTVAISPHASRVHRLTAAHLRGAPSFAVVWQTLAVILARRPVVIYNHTFDMRLLRQSALAHALPFVDPPQVHCALAMYASFHARMKLAAAAEQCGIALPAPLHRAAADAELTRRLVRFMAGF